MTTTQNPRYVRSLLRGETIYKKMPEGWQRCHGSCAPRGYAWINNGKSPLGGQYKHALLKIS